MAFKLHGFLVLKHLTFMPGPLKTPECIMAFPVFVRTCVRIGGTHYNHNVSVAPMRRPPFRMFALSNKFWGNTAQQQKRDHFHFQKTFRDLHILRAIISFYFYFQFSCLLEKQTRDHNAGTVFTSFHRNEIPNANKQNVMKINEIKNKFVWS